MYSNSTIFLYWEHVNMCTIGGFVNNPEIIKLFPRFCPNIRCDRYSLKLCSDACFLWTQNFFTFITTKVVVSSLDLSGQPFGRALLIHLFGNRKCNVAWILLQYQACLMHTPKLRRTWWHFIPKTYMRQPLRCVRPSLCRRVIWRHRHKRCLHHHVPSVARRLLPLTRLLFKPLTAETSNTLRVLK